MDGTPARHRSTHHRHKPFQPAIGSDFGRVEEVEARARGFLTRFISGGAAVAVGLTGYRGVISGDYTALVAVWAVAGPIIGAMVAYYFGPQRMD